MLTIQDLLGQEEGLTDFKEITRNRKVNGEKTLSLTILPTVHNKHSFPLVGEESILTFDGEQYVIKKHSERGLGNKFIKRSEAIHKFFVDMINKQQPLIHNGSMTFDAFLQFIFQGTGYTYTILDTFYAQSFENFGNDNRLALLQKGLERYKAEIEIVGTDVRFKVQIGNDSDFQFRFGHNIKTIEKNVDTTNLATVISGTGAEGITAYYRSPNADIFGEIEAPPVNDERFTSEESLLAELQSRLQDTPEFSITIDFADLRAAGYPWTVPNEGDRVFVIYEPMDDLLLETRIMEINELLDADLKPVKTYVTLANYKKTFAGTMFDTVQKQFKKILDDSGQIKYSLLDEAVRRATEMLLGSATEIEYTENGIVARSKDNPNHLVLVSSSGVGVSTDNGQIFQEAITAEGIVASLITVGTMLADRIKGGTLSLGGPENGNGKFQLLNAAGEIIADLDAERRGFSDLYVANLESPTVVQTGVELNTNYYVAEYADANAGVGQPDDSNDGLSWAKPLRTVGEAIRRIPKYIISGLVTIYLAYGHKFYENITIRGFIGGGAIRVNAQNKATTIVGDFRAFHNSCSTELYYGTFNATGSYAGVQFWNTNGYCVGVKVNGLANNGTEFGIDVLHRSVVQVQDCETYSVQRGVAGRYGGTAYAVNNVGYGSVCGLHTNGGFITGYGTCPNGAAAAIQNIYGGQTFGGFTANNGSYTPPAPPETTSTWNQTDTDSWHDGYNVWDNTTNDPLQGKYSTAGPYRGCWFFGSSPSSAVTGKAIKQIRVYLQRASNSGNSGTQTAVIRPHGYTSKPAGEPAYLAASHSVGFKWGEGKWVTLPSSFHSLFANGSAKGIMIYTTDNSQYMRFVQAAKLEITYA